MSKLFKFLVVIGLMFGLIALGALATNGGPPRLLADLVRQALEETAQVRLGFEEKTGLWDGQPYCLAVVEVPNGPQGTILRIARAAGVQGLSFSLPSLDSSAPQKANLILPGPCPRPEVQAAWAKEMGLVPAADGHGFTAAPATATTGGEEDYDSPTQSPSHEIRPLDLPDWLTVLPASSPTLLILVVIVVLTAGFALAGSTRSRSTNYG